MGLITALLVYTHLEYNWLTIKVPQTFQTVLGLVVGLLLVFRTNTAYDRWWEGRKQLGMLVNQSRDLALKISSYMGSDWKHYRNCMQILAAFPWCLKEHLREQDYTGYQNLLPRKYHRGFISSDHKPNYLLMLLSQLLQKAYKKELISGEQLIILEKKTSLFVDILGACERIRNTPIPFSYNLHLKRILFIYMFIVPIGFIDDLNWWAIPVVMIIFYTMVGIEALGEEIEEPFGTDPNDLPFDMLATKIANNIREIESATLINAVGAHKHRQVASL
jgi:putative membrane protein